MAPTSALALLFLASFQLRQLCHADSHLHSKGLPSDQQFDRDALFKEMENVEFQLSSLEKDLMAKNTDLANKEDIIQSLKDKLHAVKEGGRNEVEAMLDRTRPKSKQLVKMVAELGEALNEKRLELLLLRERAQTLETAGKRHMSQHEKLEKVLRDQKQQTDNLEKSLQHAREALRQMAAQYDAKSQELREAHSQWLPPWASKHVSYLQSVVSNQLSTHVRPLSDPVICKVSGKIIAIQNWWKCHFQAMTKVAENSSSQYVDKATAVFQPYFKRVQVLCKPYTQKITKNYKRYVKHATKHHLKLQSMIQKTLKKNKYLASITSKELVWFLASAVLIMPLYGVLMLLSAFVGGRKHSAYVKGASPHRHRKVRQSKRFNS